MCCFFREWDRHVFHHSLHRIVDSTHWTLPHTREQCHKPTVEDMIWHNLSVLSRRHMLLELSEDRHRTGRLPGPEYLKAFIQDLLHFTVHLSFVLSLALNRFIWNLSFSKKNLILFLIRYRKLSYPIHLKKNY